MQGPEPNGVVAVFPTREAIDQALDWLRIDGVDRRTITILGPNMIQELPPELDRSPKHSGEIGSYWAKWGAALGALAGAGPVSIALAAATVGVEAMVPVVAMGFGTVVATATVGAMSAGLVAAGVHERHARRYQRALREGKFVLVVHSDDMATLRAATHEFDRLRAESVDVHGLVGLEPPNAPVHERVAPPQNR
jgi:hypothetical protein